VDVAEKLPIKPDAQDCITVFICLFVMNLWSALEQLKFLAAQLGAIKKRLEELSK